MEKESKPKRKSEGPSCSVPFCKNRMRNRPDGVTHTHTHIRVFTPLSRPLHTPIYCVDVYTSGFILYTVLISRCAIYFILHNVAKE